MLGTIRPFFISEDVFEKWCNSVASANRFEYQSADSDMTNNSFLLLFGTVALRPPFPSEYIPQKQSASTAVFRLLPDYITYHPYDQLNILALRQLLLSEDVHQKQSGTVLQSAESVRATPGCIFNACDTQTTFVIGRYS